MVQDTFDPEFFLSTYEVQRVKDGSTRLCTAMYRDVLNCAVSLRIVELFLCLIGWHQSCTLGLNFADLGWALDFVAQSVLLNFLILINLLYSLNWYIYRIKKAGTVEARQLWSYFCRQSLLYGTLLVPSASEHFLMPGSRRFIWAGSSCSQVFWLDVIIKSLQ